MSTVSLWPEDVYHAIKFSTIKNGVPVVYLTIGLRGDGKFFCDVPEGMELEESAEKFISYVKRMLQETV